MRCTPDMRATHAAIVTSALQAGERSARDEGVVEWSARPFELEGPG